MKSNRTTLVRIARLFTVALVAMAFAQGCKERAGERETEESQKASKGLAKLSVESGQMILVMDAASQQRLGLEVTPLKETVTREQVTVPAVVLSAQDLATFRNGFVAAQAQLQKSRIESSVALKEYARLKTLFDANQNVSEKALQAAEGAAQMSESDVRSAEQQVTLQESVVRQEWGSVVSKWAVETSPDLQLIFDQREFFVQLTLPASVGFSPPSTVALEIPGSSRAEARLVSSLPRVDPRIQGKSFLYIVRAHSGLSPGVNLVAHLSVGNQMRGVTVPTSAVVWSEGKAWVYQQTAADRFARTAVATDVAVENGFFVSSGLSAGDKVVIQGAQSLLSEELLMRGRAGGEIDEQ